MTAQQVMLRPLGIITQPNKMGSIPPGAFREAYAGYIRDPGVLEQAINWTEVQNIGGDSTGGNLTPKMYVITFANSTSTYCLTLWQHFNGNWAFTWTDLSGVGTPQTDFLYNEIGYGSNGNQILSSSGLCSWVTTRNRTLLTCTLGAVVWDYTSPGTTLQAHPRQAGMLPPNNIVFASPADLGLGGALDALRWCHVTAVLRRTYPDGYSIVSAPCVATHAYAPSKANIQITLKLFANFAKEGDVLEIYRTRSQEYTSVSATNTGSDFYRSMSVKLTAADVSAGLAVIKDVTPDGLLGEALYTNDAIQGAAAAANPPPTAQFVKSFKGHTFYLGTLEPPQFRMRTPVHWGSVDTGSTDEHQRRYGIGRRFLTGSVSSGAFTITGISAADIIGLVIGQRVYHSTAFPTGLGRITAVGATSITVSIAASATASASGAFYCDDLVEVDGFSLIANTLDGFLDQLSLLFPKYYSSFLLSRVQPKSAGGIVPTIPGDYLVVRRADMWSNAADPAKHVISVRATNGFNFDPQLPRIELGETARAFTSTTKKNGWAWSERDQPECVPPANYNTIGTGDLYGGFDTRDACFIFASDGLWRISGNGGDAGSGYDWRADLVHKSIRLAGPQACVAMHDVGYAYTNLGLVSIDSSGNVTPLSEGLVGDRMPGQGWPATLTYTPSTCVFVIADPDKNEIILREPQLAPDIFWRYNAHTQTFMWDYAGNAPLHGSYSEYIKAPIIALSSDYGHVYAQNGTTYRTMDVSYQPVFADSPFTQKHWQIVNVVADDVTSAVTAFANGVSMGTRTLTPGGFGFFSRQGFHVPRAAPAMANNISIGVQVAAGAVKTRLQGVAINYVDFTNQRHKR